MNYKYLLNIFKITSFTLVLVTFLSAQQRTTSYNFIQHSPDAAVKGQGGSDMVIFSSSSLQNNVSAVRFTHKGFELSSSYTGETMLNNGVALSGFFDYKKVKFGVKSQYLFSKDDYSVNYNISKNNLYSGGYLGGSASFFLGDLLTSIKIPISFGVGANIVSERVFENRSSAILFDFGITTAFLEKTLFIAFSMNNWGPGFENTETPKNLNFGAKYIYKDVKLVDFVGSFRYTFDELSYNSLAFGISAVVLMNYNASFGYNFDLMERGKSLNHGFNFGLGARVNNYKVEFAVSPKIGFNTDFSATVKYMFIDEFVGIPYDLISTLSIKKIIQECKKGIRHEKWEYAAEMAKNGLVREPGNDELIDLFMLIRDKIAK